MLPQGCEPKPVDVSHWLVTTTQLVPYLRQIRRRFIFIVVIHKEDTFTIEATTPMKHMVILAWDWLEYRCYMLGKAVCAKMHNCFRTTHDFLFRIYKRTRIKLIQKITISLMLKVFEVCGFCFEMHYFFVARADRIAQRKALRLKCE